MADLIPKVGSTFKWLDFSFKVCESDDGSCNGCYFLNAEGRCSAVNYYTVPSCTYKTIFRLIGKN